MTNKTKTDGKTSEENEKIEQLVREFKKHPLYPVIMVNTELGILRVINRNSTTSFNIDQHETKKEMDKIFEDTVHKEWTPEIEVDMCVNSGFHRIHDSDAERWELWNAGKEKAK